MILAVEKVSDFILSKPRASGDDPDLLEVIMGMDE